MADFVSVIIGILFCTTLLNKPKAWVLSCVKAISKRRALKFRDTILSNPHTAKVYNDKTWSDLDDFVSEQIKELEYSVEHCISITYYICAVICGLLGMSELYLSMTTSVGFWNMALLVLPLAICLIFFILKYCAVSSSIKKKEKDHKGFISVAMSMAQQHQQDNQKELNELLITPPEKSSSKQE